MIIVQTTATAIAPAALRHTVPRNRPSVPYVTATSSDTATHLAMTKLAGMAAATGFAVCDSICRIAMLEAAATAKVASTLAATATASAKTWPAKVRARPGNCSSAAAIVPRPQSPPAIAAPRMLKGTVP
jgi:hypothetical protein